MFNYSEPITHIEIQRAVDQGYTINSCKFDENFKDIMNYITSQFIEEYPEAFSRYSIAPMHVNDIDLSGLEKPFDEYVTIVRPVDNCYSVKDFLGTEGIPSIIDVLLGMTDWKFVSIDISLEKLKLAFLKFGDDNIGTSGILLRITDADNLKMQFSMRDGYDAMDLISYHLEMKCKDSSSIGIQTDGSGTNLSEYFGKTRILLEKYFFGKQKTPGGVIHNAVQILSYGRQ